MSGEIIIESACFVHKVLVTGPDHGTKSFLCVLPDISLIQNDGTRRASFTEIS